MTDYRTSLAFRLPQLRRPGAECTTSRALPDELRIGANDDLETKRGKEKKQYLLAYLRQHMEKLRPVLRNNYVHSHAATFSSQYS